MEKHRHVFERFATFDSMYNGYICARRDKRYKDVVLRYSANLEENIINSVNHLLWKDYQVGPISEFMEYYPKKRIICALSFPDRVVNCTAYNVLWPIYAPSMYEHSYGCMPGKGPLKATHKVQDWMRMAQRKPGEWFIGKADILKFYFRLLVDAQLEALGRSLDDPDMMRFLEKAILADGRPFGLPEFCEDVTTAERISGRGMQVGSVISQLTANVVLTPLDNYVKRELHAPYYCRYMDDMIVVAPSKSQIWDIFGAMDDYLMEHLGLQLNNRTSVVPIGNPVEFVGRKITPEKIELRRSTTLQMKRHLAFIKDGYASGKLPLEYCLSSITSYLGLMKDCNCDALRQKVLDDFVLIRRS